MAPKALGFHRAPGGQLRQEVSELPVIHVEPLLVQHLAEGREVAPLGAAQPRQPASEATKEIRIRRRKDI